MLTTIDGDKLRQLRIRKGWTLQALAIRAGVSERAIQDIERGATLQPRPNTVRWLAEALEVPPENLWLEERGAPVRRTGPEPLATLVVGDQDGMTLSHWPVVERQVRIGRDAANDVVLPDANVSQFHALLVLREDAWELRDLRSANGTVVAGVAVTGNRTLRPGESIRIASFVLELRSPDERSDPTRTVKLRRRRPE